MFVLRATIDNLSFERFRVKAVSAHRYVLLLRVLGQRYLILFIEMCFSTIGSNAVAKVDQGQASTVWQQLIGDGYVLEVEREGVTGLQLTETGMASLETNIVGNVPRMIFAVREHLPLERLTGLELALALKDRGWSWELMPKKLDDRKALVYNIGDPPGKWFTAGRALNSAYMLCLLQAEALRDRFGVLQVPHYAKKPQTDFGRLLKGLPFTDQEVAARPLALQDEPLQGEHLQQEALEDGVDGDEIVDIDYDRFEKEFGELLEE